MYIISILTIINSYQPLIGRCHGMTIPFGVYDSAVPPWWAEATQRHAPRRDPRTERFFALENVGQLRSHGTVMEQSDGTVMAQLIPLGHAGSPTQSQGEPLRSYPATNSMAFQLQQSSEKWSVFASPMACSSYCVPRRASSKATLQMDAGVKNMDVQ